VPVAGACLAAAIAFLAVPVAGRLLPTTTPPSVTAGVAVAAPRPIEPSPPPPGAPVVGPPIRLGARIPEPAVAPDPETLTGYRWPLARGRLTLPFGPYFDGSFRIGRTNVHDGIDIASFCGAPVVAAHAGVVLSAGRHFDDEIGWLGSLDAYYARLDRKDRWRDLPIVAIVDDGDGYRSVYAHFERVVVRRGQRVRAGQLIGYEGATGHATGCHVHYGLFSPLETTRFAIRPDVGRRLRTPPFEIARIDPLLVLPDGPRVLRTGRFRDPFRPPAVPAVVAGRG
jgi:murein DD-endopeptidase MepM/ murein hydrolase activator NlpD